MEKEAVIDWEREYVRWQKSGLSQRDYSQQAGYSLSVFKNGLNRTGCRQRLKKASTNESSLFVALQPSPTVAFKKEEKTDAYCEIRFNGKPGLRVESAETLGQLRGLMKGLLG